jgi:hypothetical protein
MFRVALIVSGLLALIALAFPDLVTVGFFFLIVPGIILSLAPTVFVYLLAIAIIRAVAPIPPGVAGWVVSVLLAAAIGWGVVLPMREFETLRWRAQIKPDVVPAQSLRLSGDIVLQQPVAILRKHKAIACDYVCAALLDTPGISAVIVERGDNRLRFRLVPKGSAPDQGVRPVDPQNILNVFDKIGAKARRAKFGMVRPYEQTKAMQDAVAAEWALRLNTRQTLVGEPVAEGFKPDWTVKIINEDKRGDPVVERLEIRDQGGQVLLRRSVVKHRVYFDFFVLACVGGMENAHWEIGRKTLSTSKEFSTLDAPYELLSHVTVARPHASADARTTFRAAVIAALDNPGASSEQLLVANDWLKQLDYRFTPDDQRLAVRIAEDLRAPLSAPLLQRFLDKRPTVDFRHGLVVRILDPATNSNDRGYYVRWLSRMPVGTFAQPTADEQRIWADQNRYADTAPFLERLADTGPAGLQRLTSLIQEFARIDSWPKRQPLIRAVRRGFARMGIAAEPALSVVLPLLGPESSPLVNEWQEQQEWNMTLVRMGLPVDRLPMSSNLSADQVAQERQRTLEAVRKYNPDQRNGYNY